MVTHEMQVIAIINNGIVTKVTKSAIYQPKTQCIGGGIKWYEDKRKGKVVYSNE